jgi:hypothetical protein
MAKAKVTPDDLLRRYLESDESVFSKIHALKVALASLEAEARAVNRAYSSRRVGGQLLELMDQMEPAIGALISLGSLRRQATYIDRADFDDAIIDMATDGVVNLHRHDYPASLTKEEKEDMVPDGRGGYFIGVVRRVAVSNGVPVGGV